jgi:MFS family permease
MATSKPTPLPIKAMALAALIQFSNLFSMYLIFPFMPFMVHDFFPALSPEEIGYQAGYLGSAYQAGQLVSSIAWGRIADIYGRRPALIFGCGATIFSIVCFGFSSTFTWAVRESVLLKPCVLISLCAFLGAVSDTISLGSSQRQYWRG